MLLLFYLLDDNTDTQRSVDLSVIQLLNKKQLNELEP